MGCAREYALPLGDPTQPYGILLVEAKRLMDEFHHTCDVLQHAMVYNNHRRPVAVTGVRNRK